MDVVPTESDRNYLTRPTAYESKRVATTGYAATLPMTDDEKTAVAEKEKTRPPIGFDRDDG